MPDSQSSTTTNRVIGGGLVGCLAAAMLSTQGFTVDLYEGRSDPRDTDSTGPSSRARSINLAVSNRGIHALQKISGRLAEQVLVNLVPMHGRMIHTVAGDTQSQKYGLHGEAIYSIDRQMLNNTLLTQVSQMDRVTTHFNMKLSKAQFDQGLLTFANGQEVKTDLVVGTDGAYSKVRQEMMRVTRMDYSQNYIDHSYLELSIPPSPQDGGFQLDPNRLHIWPRKDFMLIALPNDDKSFTCTLFAPPSTFASLADRPQAQLDFFSTHFKDAVDLITPDTVTQAFAQHPISPLLRSSCSPYHYSDKVILLGDASHTMPPFYGQGLNCGFEDVRVLHELLTDKHNHSTLGQALQRYSERRHQDLLAIQDLALANYTEMASRVVDPLYLLRKSLDGALARVLGESLWCPLYTMVTFKSDVPYSQAQRREERQKKVLAGVVNSTAAAAVLGLGWAALWGYKRWSR